MMTLNEAIEHCKERADCSLCGQEHKQLQEWLEDYKRLKTKKTSGITVELFLKRYCNYGQFEARSAYDGKKLFTSIKGKAYLRWKDCEIGNIWSEIKVDKATGYAAPVTCFYVYTGAM